jgi:Nuclease-related domain
MQNTSPFPSPPKERSPFPEPSLPQPGESLQQTALNLFEDKVLFYVLYASTLFGVTIIEWCQWWLGKRISPWFWTALTVIFALFALYRWFKFKPRMLELKLGVRGEREIGRMLEHLRVLGYVPFHDIPCKGFNIDHALIGPGGIFAIETKTRSKHRGSSEVEYDGKRVLVDGIAPDRDPVAQVEGNANHLQQLMKDMTGRDIDVRPVVLFPGWYVTRQPRGCRTWVLNFSAFTKFVENESVHLSPEDIALYTDRLTRHLRSEFT